jgi:C4-dicarboxylate-specific signal transduction histidine kinase
MRRVWWWQYEIRALGLQPDSLDRIFHAFYTTKPEGMGMGLAISRSIVEAQGGRLWTTPSPTHGATFLLSCRGCDDLGFARRLCRRR